MRKDIKTEVFGLAKMLSEAQLEIKKLIDNNNLSATLNLLVVCEEAVFKIDQIIGETNEMTENILRSLEEYCEVLFQISEVVEKSSITETNKLLKKLNKVQIKIENSIKHEIIVRKEIVFLPYNASMWDSLESVWEAAIEDGTFDVFVVPIPFFGLNPDGSVKEAHYEADLFPENVTITHYNNYDFEKRKPDTIFIHNPYDNNNIVTSVHPNFYTENLKKYTENLVYIPYFVLSEIDKNDENAINTIKHFCLNTGIFNSNKVIVQSENYREIYIKVLTDFAGENTRRLWEDRVLGLGSPKLDSKNQHNEENIPEEWKDKIYNENKSKKVVVFYNTSINGLLKYSEKYIEKMEMVFKEFEKQSDEFIVLWRPHPLLKDTIHSMRPELLEKYQKIEDEFIKKNFGIYDKSSDLNRAINFSDKYFGDESSVVELFKKQKKQIMIQHIE